MLINVFTLWSGHRDTLAWYFFRKGHIKVKPLVVGMGTALRRLVAALAMAALVTVLLLPALFCIDSVETVVDTPNVPRNSVVNAIEFPDQIDTSLTMPEYSMIARALMLPSGAVDATLGDINGDGLIDLMVAVSESKNISIFYGQPTGAFLSYPSMNITLPRSPVAVDAVDAFNSGHLQIVVLERKLDGLDTDHIAIYNWTSNTSYSRIIDRTPYTNAVAFEYGEFTGDAYLDIAIACTGPNPSATDGRIEIRHGPLYTDYTIIVGGKGTDSIVAGDYDHNGSLDLAVGNYYDENVLIYCQPLSDLMPASQTLLATGSILDITSGRMDSDSMDDLAVVVESPSALLFYFQSVGLQPSPDPTYSRSLNITATTVESGDMSGDGLDDVLLLSTEDNSSFGYFQRSSSNIWPSDFDFHFPTGGLPRAALIGDLDSRPGADLAISTARSDWSGSSLAMYSGEAVINPMFSNSNATTWTNNSDAADAIGSGDVNGDGIDDLLVLYRETRTLSYVLSFNETPQDLSIGFIPDKMLVTDLNGDNHADVLISHDESPRLNIVSGQDDISLPIVWFELNCTGNVTDFATGDFNNDSLRDVVAVTDLGRIDIFFNSGVESAPFGPSSEIVPIPEASIPALCVGDFDSDGLDDIAYSRPLLNIEILTQKSAPPYFSLPADYVLFHSSTGFFTSLWSGDLNTDGKADIAAMRPSDPGIYLFDQDDLWSVRHPYWIFQLPELPKFVSVIDVTDDSLADIVVTFDSADLLFVYRQASGLIPSLPSMTFVTGASPNYVIVGDGTHDNRGDLLVCDSSSHSVSIWSQINVPPVAHANGPYSTVEGETIVLRGFAETGYSERSHMQYRWQFGDGFTGNWSGNPDAAHVYMDEGVLDAVFEVKDPAGLTANDSCTVTVTDSVPRVDFVWSPETPSEGQVVTFTDNTSSHDTVDILNWTVDGDLVSTGANSTVEIAFQNGTHTIILEATDSDGSVGQISKYLTVSRKAPEVAISAPSTMPERTEVEFWATVDQWHSGQGDWIVSYEWNFSYSGLPFVVDSSSGTLNHTAHSFDISTSSHWFQVAVRATDNDGDWSVAVFIITIYDVIMLTVSTVPSGPWEEFDTVVFEASVDSSSSPTLFEWDFDAQPTGFTADTSTANGTSSHYYGRAGNFLVKVRVTVDNGSSAMNSTYITVSDVNLSGNWIIDWSRNSLDTSNITFDARDIASAFPDLTRSIWQFGDGTSLDLPGGPQQLITHKYVPSRDFTVNLTITDGEDGNWRSFYQILKLRAPTIDLVSPSGDDVVRSGTPVRFAISDDSQSLTSVMYSLDVGAFVNFTKQWEINTTSWDDGTHWISIVAEDPDGNIANMSGVKIVVDNIKPVIVLGWSMSTVYGGDKVNITVTIDDPNIDDSSVVLHVEFPGDNTYSQFLMSTTDRITFYVLVEVPKRAGDMEFYVTASDQAENTQTTSETTVTVKLHFIDYAMPYLVALAVLSAMLTAVYFLRETKIAVDETFVIYNDGRLIAHSTRRLKPGMDDQILGSMFVAIQDFVKESFKDVTSFTLRKLEFGEKSVLIEKGDHLFLAVILHGKASRKVASRMELVVDEIEETFSELLKAWDGDLDSIRGVNDIIKKLYSRAPMLPASFRRLGR